MIKRPPVNSNKIRLEQALKSMNPRFESVFNELFAYEWSLNGSLLPSPTNDIWEWHDVNKLKTMSAVYKDFDVNKKGLEIIDGSPITTFNFKGDNEEFAIGVKFKPYYNSDKNVTQTVFALGDSLDNRLTVMNHSGEGERGDRFTIRVADGIGDREAHILMHPGYKTDDIVSVYLHKKANKYQVYAKINDDRPQVVSFISNLNPPNLKNLTLGASWDNSAILNGVFADLVYHTGDKINPAKYLDADSRRVREPMVVIGLDDGNSTDYTIAYQLMEARGLKGVSYLATDFMDNGHLYNDPNWDTMTWAQAKELQDAGWSVEAHTKTHPNEVMSLSDAELVAEINHTKQRFLDNGLKAPKHFAYPTGRFDARTENILKQHYTTLRNTVQGLEGGVIWNPHRRNSLEMHMHNEKDLEIVKSYIDWAIQENAILDLYTHRISENPRSFECKPEYFEALLDYIVDRDVRVVTLDELVGIMG